MAMASVYDSTVRMIVGETVDICCEGTSWLIAKMALTGFGVWLVEDLAGEQAWFCWPDECVQWAREQESAR
jgi:hypothetical protein